MINLYVNNLSNSPGHFFIAYSAFIFLDSIYCRLEFYLSIRLCIYCPSFLLECILNRREVRLFCSLLYFQCPQQYCNIKSSQYIFVDKNEGILIILEYVPFRGLAPSNWSLAFRSILLLYHFTLLT